MKTKKPVIPRAMLKDFVEDIKRLSGSNEGRLFILEILEEMPYEIRSAVIECLSSFHEPEMVDFFHLLKMEYQEEYESICNRALTKYKLLGMDINQPEIFCESFFGAYASCSRHTGRITLDVAWDKGGNGLQVECFYLTFNVDGLHSFFLVENMSIGQYLKERKKMADMVELSYEEACFLVQQAHSLNIRHMNRPALGRFLYQKYLQNPANLNHEQERYLMRRISARLNPRQLVNSLFYGLKHEDYNYLFGLLLPEAYPSKQDIKQVDILDKEAIFIEGAVTEVHASTRKAMVKAYSINLEERDFYERHYIFYLYNKTGLWFIENITVIEKKKIHYSSAFNPFCNPSYCKVYEIMDIDALFNKLDEIEGIREIKELPRGMHMRITYYEDDLNTVISFMSGVVADLVINGGEFVVISGDYQNVMELDEFLNSAHNTPLLLKGDYEVNTFTAYCYLSGDYMNFEDIMVCEEDKYAIFDDGMRLISARYLIKNQERVAEYMSGLSSIKYKLPCAFEVYYQVEKDCEDTGFVAEYILGHGWIMVSTFGEMDMTRARQEFEEELHTCLEFEGLELREEGIFDILSMDIKKEHPDLLKKLKDMYLNKWYHSHLAVLHGMSPSEASQTEEGGRLLWDMFKKIKRKENQRYENGRPNNIYLKEYIRKVEQKSRKK